MIKTPIQQFYTLPSHILVCISYLLSLHSMSFFLIENGFINIPAGFGNAVLTGTVAQQVIRPFQGLLHNSLQS